MTNSLRHKLTVCRTATTARARVLILARLEPVVRRTMVAGLLATALAASFVPLAFAAADDANWWQRITSASPNSEADRDAKAERAQRSAAEPPSAELRADTMPLASDESLQTFEAAVQRYQQLVANGGWPTIRAGRNIRPGEDDERVPLLGRRLTITGELKRPWRGDTTYGPELEAAVKLFQTRNGIRPSGIVDKPTFDALNISADQRLSQLRVNHARLRDLANAVVPLERYVLVNAAAFQLEAVDRHNVVGRHRVIVGKPDRQTPGVRAFVKNINFLPFWHVPESVAHLDLIPRLQKDPEYLRREKIRVLTTYKGAEIPAETLDWRSPDVLKYKFQQDPGQQNALGIVRLDMPNEHTVYMHDTPMKTLFGQRSRAFSAGCVRVEGVLDLAVWLLRDIPGWDRQRMEEIVASGVPQDVPLPRPVPVHFTYVTAWATPDGAIHFRPDMYSRDGVQGLMAASSTEPLPAQSLAP